MRQHVRVLDVRCRQRMRSTAGVLVAVAEEPGHCPICVGSMEVQKTIQRHGMTLEHGAFEVRETVHVCGSGCRHCSGALVTRRAASLAQRIPRGSVVGYDVMVFVGLQRFLHFRQRDEIRTALLCEHGLSLSTGEVSKLAERFTHYLQRLHDAHAQAIRAALTQDGGWPLHADAILPCLRSTLHRFGAPCAVMRDLGRAMIPAVADLLTESKLEIPVLACHQHFLSEVGMDLLKASYGELRKAFRSFKVRPGLRSLARDLGRKLQS